MNRATRTFSLCLLATALAAGLSPASRADSLEDRQKAVAAKQQNTQLAKEYHATYILVRDTLFAGTDGIDARAKSWNALASAWISKWARMQTCASIIQDANSIDCLDGLEGDGIEKDIQRRSSELEQLRDSAAQLDAQVARALAALARTKPASPDTSSDQLSGSIRASIAASTRLAQSLRSVSGLSEQVARMQEAHSISKSMLSASIATALANHAIARLEKSLGLVRDALRYDELVEPQLDRVRSASLAARSHRLESRYFHARDAVAKLASACSDARAAIASSGLPADTVRAAQQAADQACQEQTLFARWEAGADAKADLVYSIHDLKYRKYMNACSARVQDMTVNCALFGIIAKISEDQVYAMSEQQLRAYEDAWSRIGEGRL